MTVLYRVRQFFRMAGVLPEGADEQVQRELVALLSPAEQILFMRLPKADQRHSIQVAARLRHDGHTDPLLLRAALLHDVGKAEAEIRLWHRTAVVLLGRFAPWLLDRLIGREPVSWERSPGAEKGWRRTLFVARHHAALGAEQLERAGSPAELVWLVRHHECPGSHPLGRLLRAYDSTD